MSDQCRTWNIIIYYSIHYIIEHTSTAAQVVACIFQFIIFTKSKIFYRFGTTRERTTLIKHISQTKYLHNFFHWPIIY